MLIERMMLLKRAVYTSDESKNSRFLILCFVEIIGIAIGSYLAVHYESNEFLRKYFCAELYGGKALEIFGSSVLILTIFLGTAFFLGLFALGQPLGIVLLMCMGGKLGCSIALLYSEKGINAVPAVLLLYLPRTAAVSVVALLATREVFRNSSYLLRSMLGTADPPNLKSFCIRFLVLFAAALIISAFESLLNYFFGGFVL